MRPICDAPSGWRTWAAEGIGTGLMMLAGLSGVALSTMLIADPSLRLVLIGALFGGGVSLIAVSPLGRISGAHLNPVITLAFYALGRTRSRDVAPYLVVQFAGALAGSLAFRALWSPDVTGVTHSSVSVPAALALEAVMTAALVTVVLAFSSRPRLAPWTPLAIWPVITLLTWQGSPLTGTSLNPARSEGPAVAFADFADLWLYFPGPLAGALGAAIVWRGVTAGPRTRQLPHGTASEREEDRRAPRSRRQERAGHGRQLRDRPGDRGALR